MKDGDGARSLTKISVCCGLKFHCMLACVSALNVTLMTRSFTGVIVATCSMSCPATAVPPSPVAWRQKLSVQTSSQQLCVCVCVCAHLAVESIQRHCGVCQADHSHAGCGDVGQRSLVPVPPLLLLTLGLPAPPPTVEVLRTPPPQEVLSLRAQPPWSATAKRPDASR